MTRRRLLFVVGIVLGAGWTLLTVATDDIAVLVATIAVLLSLLWPVGTPMLGQRVGFPFEADYSRPVSTRALVTVAMLYLGLATAAAYAAPLLVLGAVFDVPFPLWPVTGRLAAIMSAIAAGAWWTSSKSATARNITIPAAMLAVLLSAPAGSNLPAPATWSQPAPFELASLIHFLIVIAVAYAITLLGVTRQRRGDKWRDLLDEERRGLRGVPKHVAEIHRIGAAALFRLRCPSTSPTRAEIWLEMKYRVAPMLLIAAAIAAIIPIIFWAFGRYGPVLPLVIAVATLVIPLTTGANASLSAGSPQGRMGAFEAARPAGTARLVGMQVLVIVAGTLLASALITASIWASFPLLRDAPGLQRNTIAALTAMPLHRAAGWTVMLLVGLATVAALMRALSALGRKHGKGLMIASVSLTIIAAVLALTAVRGWLAGPTVEAVFQWSMTATLVTGTLGLFWRTLADRIFSARGVAAAVAAWAVFASIYLAFLHSSGILVPDAPARLTAFLLSSSLLPLAAFALAPWSFGLLRHS